jgi:hypothetical protein
MRSTRDAKFAQSRQRQQTNATIGWVNTWPVTKVAFGKVKDEIVRPAVAPNRPSGMCEAQHVDFIAACEGRITWRQYFATWGHSALTP